MLSDIVVGLLVGFSAGAASMWYYFHKMELIRTREEWEIMRRDD